MKRFWENNKVPLVIFTLWRIWTLVVGYVAAFILPYKTSFVGVREFLVPSGLPQWLWQWGNFDGVHYLNIAKNGYAAQGEEAFFPFYPLLTHLFGGLTGNYFLAGFIISNLAALLLAILFFKLCSRKFNQDIALWATIFMFFYPLSFYLGAIYTESLFLLLIVTSLLLSGLVSKMCAILAGATRLIGTFLLPFGPAGLIGYMGYLWGHSHNALAFLTAQSMFNNNRASSLATLVTPPQVLYRYAKIFLTVPLNHYDFWIAVIEFAAFVGAIGLLSFMTYRRKVSLVWLFFSWAAVLLPTITGTLSSMPRYVMAAFPIFIGLAQILPKRGRVVFLALSIVLLSLFTILFVRGYWIS